MVGWGDRSQEQYGFARRQRPGEMGSPTSPHALQAEDGQAEAFPPRTLQPRRLEPRPSPPASGDDRWIVRPKTSPVGSRPRAKKRRSPAGPRSAVAPGGRAPVLAPSSPTGERPRRWLAFCLAGTVYAVGIAGLWSMYRSFDEGAASPLMPAGDSTTLPALNDTIDIRDAHLNGPVRPALRPHELKPDAPDELEEDVAASDLRKRI